VTLVTLTVPGATVPEQAADSRVVSKAELAIWLGTLVRAAIERSAPAS
jgi:hypothetical protein